MPLQIFTTYNTELDRSDVCENRERRSSSQLLYLPGGDMGESSWAAAPQHGPEGSVKAARQFTIAPQQGEGD